MSSWLFDQPNVSLYHVQSATSSIHLGGRVEFEARTLEDLTRFSRSLYSHESIASSSAEYQQARLRRGITTKKLWELIKPNEQLPSEILKCWGLTPEVNTSEYLATVTRFLRRGPDSILNELLEFGRSLAISDGANIPTRVHVAYNQLMARLVHPCMVIPVVDDRPVVPNLPFQTPNMGRTALYETFCCSFRYRSLCDRCCLRKNETLGGRIFATSTRLARCIPIDCGI